MGWKKLEGGRQVRPEGAAIVIYKGTSTMYASVELRAIAPHVAFEINDGQQLLRVTPDEDGVDISSGCFNFRPLRQLFRGINENKIISLTEQDGKFVGCLQEEI